MGHGVISYNSEPKLTKKRVLFTPTVTTDTLRAGYVVCYDHDRNTDMSGTSVAAGTLNPARFLCVEKPKTANLRFVAGIVCPESEGAVNGDWIDIYELNGADIQVWTDQDCTNGTTTLAATDGSYICTATGAANVALGLAKDTINRSVDNGFCLMKSYPTAGLIGDITAVSAALSTLQESAVSDLTSAVSDLDSRCDSLTTAIASVESSLSSVIASQAVIASDATSEAKASGHSELLSQAKILSDLVETVDSKQNDSITSLIAADDSLESALSDATSAVKESAFSHISSLEVNLSDAISAVKSDLVSALSDVDSRCDSLATALASVESTLSSVIASQAKIASAATSDAQASVTALANDATSVLASTKITSTTSLLVCLSKITLADGTTFSCVTNVKSAS